MSNQPVKEQAPQPFDPSKRERPDPREVLLQGQRQRSKVYV